jgi:hypothetical protein
VDKKEDMMGQMKAKRERMLAEKAEADRLERQKVADERKRLLDAIAAGEKRSQAAEAEREELAVRLKEEARQVASFKISVHDLRSEVKSAVTLLTKTQEALDAKEAELAAEITGQIDKEDEMKKLCEERQEAHAAKVELERDDAIRLQLLDHDAALQVRYI